MSSHSADNERTPAGVELPADEVGRVRALCERLGIPGVIDVHTHFMPQNVLDKVWNYFDHAERLTGVPWPVAYRFGEAERVARLRELGVLRFTSLLYPHKPQMAQWLNEWATDFAARTPDCAHSATFYPEDGAGDYVAAAIDSGAQIFKAHVQVGGYDPADRLLDPVWGVLSDARLPVVIHAGSGPEPGNHTGPEPIADVLRRFPKLALVAAHMGMPEYAAFIDFAERFENVYLDTTMVFTDFTERMHPFPAAERGRLAGLGDKVVLGSDFPNIPYPFVHQLEAIDRFGLGDEWTRKVLYDNPARLIGGGE